MKPRWFGDKMLIWWKNDHLVTEGSFGHRMGGLMAKCTFGNKPGSLVTECSFDDTRMVG